MGTKEESIIARRLAPITWASQTTKRMRITPVSATILTVRLDKAVNIRGSEALEVRDEDSSLYLGLQSFMESNPQLQVNSP